MSRLNSARRLTIGRFAKSMLPARLSIALIAYGALSLPAVAGNRSAAPEAAPRLRQSLSDAWWTGPIIANSAATLPKGHFLVEPYLYDVTSDDGDSFGSLTYMLYGITNRLTVGVVPVFGYNAPSHAPDSTGIGAGDISILAQYQLRSFHAAGRGPDISLQVQETLPTGRYDRLDDRPGDGFGSGTRSTLLQLNTQYYFWMPNGRILRMRVNFGKTFSRSATVDGVSVYGTPPGFHGTVSPGNSISLNGAWEYSVSRRWVLALDLTYGHRQSTRVRGSVPSADTGTRIPITIDLASRDTYGIAPGIEYNFSPRTGVIFGVRYLKTPGAGDSLTPVVAINYVR